MGATPGQLLRDVRRRHGLTQAQLAARARTSQAAISRIERDLVSPSVATLAHLVDLMGEELSIDATQIDYGHDRTLLRENLRRSAAERIDFMTDVAEFVERNRGAGVR
jgi:transcriptional regulator with XRE-family HTH domain